MNRTNVLNFITRANLAGLNQINAGLRQQIAILAAMTRQQAAATAAATRLAQAWRNAGVQARALAAQQLRVNAQGQGRNARGQFMSRAATQAALNQAASFSKRLRILLSQGFQANTAAWRASIADAFDKVSAHAARLGANIQKALRWQNVGAALLASLRPALDAIRVGFVNAAKIAGQAIRTFIGGALSAVNRMAGVVRGTLRNIKGGLGNLGIAGALVTIGGVKSAYTVDKLLAKINTIARETKPNLDLIAQGLQKISFTVGTTFTDNAEAYYDLLSAGLGVKNGIVDIATTMQLMRDAANLAVGGIGSMKDSLDFLTTALNAFRGPLTAEFGDPLKASTKISDAFAKSVELGKTTVAELGPVFSTAAPLAAQLGVDWREMAAILAAMTQQGFDAGETFTALRSAMVGVQRDSKKLQQAALLDTKVIAAMKKAGATTWLELLDKGGFQTFALTLRDYSERAGVPLIKLLGRIEGVQAILGVTGAQAENYKYILDQVTNASGNAAEQAALFNDSLAAQLRLFGNALFAIGDALFRRRIIDPLKDFVRELNILAGTIYQFVVSNQALFDVLVPIFTVLTALTALTKGASAIENIFLRLGGPISGFAIGIGRIGMAIALLTGPLLIAIVAFETLKSLIKYGVLPAKTFGRVIVDINVAIAELGRVAKAAGDLIVGFFRIISSGSDAFSTGFKLDYLFKRFADIAGPALDTAAAAFGLAISNFVDSVAKSFGAEFDAKVAVIGKSVLDALRSAWAWLAPRASQALGEALTFGAGVVTNVVEFGARVASNIGQAIIAALPRVAEFISGIPNAIGASLGTGGALNEMANQARLWGLSFVNWFRRNGPALAQGVVDVFNSIGKVLEVAIPKALDVLSHLWDGILEKGPEILKGISDFAGKLVGALGTLAGLIVPPLAEAAGKLIDWIAKDVIPNVVGAVARFIDKVVKALVPMGSPVGPVAGAMSDAGQQLVDWITDRIPGALRALLDWAVQVENWILTVLLPRIGLAMAAVGLAAVKALWDALVAAIRDPVGTIGLIAEAVYAVLAGAAILGAAHLAGVAVSFAFRSGIYTAKVASDALIGFGASVGARLAGAAIPAARLAGLATSAAFVAAVALPVVAVLLVTFKVVTELSSQEDQIRASAKEWVKTATPEMIRAAQSAISDAKLKLAGISLAVPVLSWALTFPALGTLNDISAANEEALRQRAADAIAGVFKRHRFSGEAKVDIKYKLEGDVASRISEIKKKFDLTETVTKFQEGTGAIVDEWNSLPDRLKTTADLLKDALKNPFDLAGTVKTFQTNYALIVTAMQSGNPKAIVLAQQLAASMTQMALDTNAAFTAAGQAPPFLIDAMGGVTLAAAGAAAVGLKNAIITPISAIPGAFTTAGLGASGLTTGITNEIPFAGKAADDLLTAVTTPFEAPILPTGPARWGGKLTALIQSETPKAGAASTALVTAVKTPLAPLPGLFTAAGTSSSGLRYGLVTETPLAGTAASGLVSSVTATLPKLPRLFTTAGAASKNFTRGIRGQIGPAGTAAGSLVGAVNSKLNPGAGGRNGSRGYRALVKSWGASVGGSWLSGIISKIARSAGSIWAAIMKALGSFVGNSPPKEGPLQHIDVWGANIGQAWIDGIVTSLEDGPARIATAVRGVQSALTMKPPAVQLAYATGGGTVAPLSMESQAARLGRRRDVLQQTRPGGPVTITIAPGAVVVDARGTDPKRVGQMVADSMAATLREQTARMRPNG